jgi:hypothetical protein
VRAVVAIVIASARRRWPSWLGVALLVAIFGGTVLVGATAARHTASAVPDPAGLVLAVAVGTLVCALALSAVPGALAGRTSPALVLRDG